MRHQVAACVIGEEQVACGRQQTIHATAGRDAGVANLPRGLARVIVHRHKVAAKRAQPQLILTAQPHRSARISGGQVVHGVALLRVRIKQAGLWAVRRRWPVHNAAVRW